MAFTPVYEAGVSLAPFAMVPSGQPSELIVKSLTVTLTGAVVLSWLFMLSLWQAVIIAIIVKITKSFFMVTLFFNV